MKSCNVAVYGASGHTGGFVVEELERRGVSVMRIARRAPALDAVAPASWRMASCDDPDALDRALEGADAVINCAGPFCDTAPAVIEAALRSGVHYIDVAAEQRVVRQSLATYDEEASARGVVVLPAMGFYGALADLLAAQLCAQLAVVERIQIGVALDYWHPTQGSRRTGERNTARRLMMSEGRLTPVPAPPPRGRWRFPEPFGELSVTATALSEIVTISRHIPAVTIESYMSDAPLRDIARADTPPPTAGSRSDQRFMMDVAVSGKGKETHTGEVRRCVASGRDIYGVSAPLAVEACLRVLAQCGLRGGSFAPAQLFSPVEFLASLSADLRIAAGDPSHPMVGSLLTR